MSTKAIREALAELRSRREDGGSSNGSAVEALTEVEAIEAQAPTLEALRQRLMEERDGADREVARSSAEAHKAYWEGRRVTAALVLAHMDAAPKT